MKRKLFLPIKLFAIAMALLAPIATTYAQKDVTQPGDPVIASSANSPGSEGVANIIDGQPTKYLNRDSATAGKVSGFVVTPSVGVTRVTGMTMQSANDAADRDPKEVTLEGSNDDTIADFASGNWDLIVRLSDLAPWTARFQTKSFSFPNFKAYKHYRWTVVSTQGPSTCCFQMAEVELLGSTLPKDVTQPGDPIIASSANSPGSEGVANAIDGQPTKYLNRDSATAGLVSGFVVTPAVGKTVVSGMVLQSANDAPDRDPKSVTLEGSNDDTVADFKSGNWTKITTLDNITPWPTLFPGADRFKSQTFLFDNFKPFKHYRWTVVTTQGPSTCCFQIAEVQLLGSGAPKDVTQPGDPIIASSANSPGSEGVANVIDGQPTKYLNRDSAVAGKVSGFVVTPSVGATAVTGMALQSANDAPDRDPKKVTLEGSNDDAIADFASGNWEMVATIDNIEPWTARFQTKEFYFANPKSYKHYRWTVVTTQGPSTCCFQIAEVELLAITEGADCNKARFLTQPVNTPVIEGATATFFTVVNGPWPVQWKKNGNNIPGANTLSYTTDPITAANASDVYTVEIVGCEASTEVKAQIFKPSAIKSIGFSFRGGGANGTPTDMGETDIAGIHPQAYWNNLNGGSGISDVITDSDNAESFAYLEWQTSGQWGAGTGSASSTQRMLNGLVYANPGSPATLHFGNLPTGNHTVILYTVGVPLQFQDVNYTVNGKKVYTRIVNADEYNAAPGFYRGTSTDANAPSLATYVRFDNVAATGGDINIEFDTTTTGFDRGGPINAVQVIFNAPAAGTPPAIAVDPQPVVGAEGDTVTLSVSAQGADLTYQWRKNGRNLPNGGNIGGATSANLTISSLSEADVASYSVAVFNPSGSVISKTVAVRVATFKIDEALAGYWKFDETGGATAANGATGAPAGAITGSAAWGAGKIGNALRFDGSTYVYVPNYTKAKRQMAASAWVNVGTSAFEGVAFLRNAIGNLGIGLGSTGNSLAGQFEFGLIEDLAAGGMRLTAAIGAGPNIVRVTQPGLFTLGSWQHVALSADGAQLRIYVNGKQVGSTDYITDINPPDAALPWLSIGARLNKADLADPNAVLGPDATLPHFMAGQIDDLALWTRALSADEVNLIYAAGNAGNALTTVKPQAPAAPPAPAKPKTLLVVGTGSVPNLNASDAGVKALLESFGFVVTVANAPASTTADADGKALVVVSSTVNSGDVAEKFQTVGIPVVMWEQAVQDNFLMTGNDATDHSTIADQTTLELVNSTHAMSSALPAGVYTVATSPQPWSWGLPTTGAVKIAQVSGDPTKVVIYGYEAGAAMFGGAVAPARRVMLFGGDNTFAALTPEGQALYAAGIRWAAGLAPAPAGQAISLGLNFGADEPNGANGFGLTPTEEAGAPGVVQANWNNLKTLTGSASGGLMANVGGAAIPTGVTVDWASNNTWASTGRSENNGTNFRPGTPDFKLLGGYLDTGAATTTTVKISAIPAELANAGYDVYVYGNGGVAAGRAGAYRIVNTATGEPITEYVLATSATAPTDYIQVPTGLGAGVYGEGTHIVFAGITAENITIEATTANGLGSSSTPRAPINAVQLVGPSMSARPAGISTEGLVAYWNFDGNLNDSIKDFNGTARGANPVVFNDGKAGFGKAITLDGGNFVEITGGNNKELQFPRGSMSIAGWFKVGAFDKSWQALISKGEGTNYRVARRGTENSLAYAGGVGEGTNDAPDVNDGNWHHFVAVSDATLAEFGTALYIDGARYEVNATAPVLDNGNLNLMIGENPGARNRQWNGSIDDISIWGRVLTAAEVGTLYAGGAGLPLSSFVVSGGAISIARSATGVTITFDGTLQSADSITGPWTDVAGATSPAAIQFSGSGKFYRSKQ